jgi:ATP-dependent DNA helicase RecG
VAFANTKGGFVYIGITDNGNIQGVNLSKESIQNWINEIKHKTQPSLIPDVEEIIENNKTIVVLKT